MKKINNKLILLSTIFFALVVLIVVKGFAPAATLGNHPYNQTNDEMNLPAIISSEVIPEFSEPSSEPEALEPKISGEVLTCTNKTDVDQVVDIRLINLDVKNKSIYLYPLNVTIDLLPEQIKRIDIYIPYGTSSIKLISGDGEEMKLKVPTCIEGRDSSGGKASFIQTETTPGEKEIPEYPTIIMPVIAIFALLFITKKRN